MRAWAEMTPPGRQPAGSDIVIRLEGEAASPVSRRVDHTRRTPVRVSAGGQRVSLASPAGNRPSMTPDQVGGRTWIPHSAANAVKAPTPRGFSPSVTPVVRLESRDPVTTVLTRTIGRPGATPFARGTGAKASKTGKRKRADDGGGGADEAPLSPVPGTQGEADSDVPMTQVAGETRALDFGSPASQSISSDSEQIEPLDSADGVPVQRPVPSQQGQIKIGRMAFATRLHSDRAVQDAAAGQDEFRRLSRSPFGAVRSSLCSHKSSDAGLGHIAVAPLPGRLVDAKNMVASSLRDLVTTGHASHLLVWGARGAGKTHVVDTAIEEVATEVQDTTVLSSRGRRLLVVKLSGWVHVGERVAMRGVARQLW